MSDLDPELERLFRAARREEDPTDEDRRAVRSALAARLTTAAAAGAAATLATGGAKAAGSAALGKLTLLGSFAAGLGAGAVVGAAVTVAVVYGSDTPTERPLASATASAPAPSRLTLPPRTPELPTEPVPSASAPVVDAPTRQGGTPSAAPSLEAETRALGDVQRALRDGRADEALRLLAEHEKEFARGALHEERAAARVIGLCALGRLAEGRAARDRFLSRYPNSPAADRVRTSCGP